MADVAKRAGVSTSTVSLVLNDKRGVSAEVRAAVLEAVDELGYRLPKRHRRTDPPAVKTIAIVHFANLGPHGEQALTGLAASYVEGIQAFCAEHNVNLSLIAHYVEGDPGHVGSHLLNRDNPAFQGLIMIYAPSRETRVLQRALGKGIPVVVISRDWPNLPVSAVGQDHPQQACLAMGHLVELGHRRIAFLAREADRPYDWFKVRLDCYRDTMTSLGEYDPTLIVVEPDVCQAAQALFARRPDVTAIFAAHDTNAMQAMRGLCSAGVDVPGQVSVIGVGDDCPSLDGCPALTTVGFPDRKVGTLAAKVLLEHIEDRELAYSRVFVDSWIVERESCAAPRDDGAP
jgi:LacI family transcriptional regulator